MKVILVLLSFASILYSAQSHSLKKYERIKLFNREFLIPDIDAKAEKISFKEKYIIKSNREIEIQNTQVKISSTDIVKINLTEYNSKTNEAKRYSFNNETKECDIITYFESDSLFKDKSILERYFEGQPMRFSLHKTYYSNGILKIKTLMYSNIVVKQYEYDKNGKLIKRFELSNRYKYSIKNILKILEKNNIKIDFKLDYRGLSITPYTYLSCAETNRGKVWYLEQYNNKKEYLIFDDTGELISQERFSNNNEDFIVLSRATYEMRYKNKAIKDVEKEMGLKLFVYDQNN